MSDQRAFVLGARKPVTSVRLPPDLVEEINEAAKRDECSQVEWLRRAVRAYLAIQHDRLQRLQDPK